MPAKKPTKPKTPRRNTSPDDPATGYALAVTAGKIIAGPYVRAACARHLADLERGDLVWDLAAANRAIGFFGDVLTVEKELRDDYGEVESLAVPFTLEPWQCFVIGSLFGWKKLDGLRRFRRAFVEIGKGNGKSPMAAGIGHYMLTATGKLRAEVYSAATDKDQAAILFRDAVSMWDRSPGLKRRLVASGINPVWQLTDLTKASFFKPISSEKKGKSGIRPYCALAADPATIDTMEYCRLEGQSEPFLDQRVGFEVDGVEFKIRHDFAAKAIDFRGLFFNAGV